MAKSCSGKGYNKKWPRKCQGGNSGKFQLAISCKQEQLRQGHHAAAHRTDHPFMSAERRFKCRHLFAVGQQQQDRQKPEEIARKGNLKDRIIRGQNTHSNPH